MKSIYSSIECLECSIYFSSNNDTAIFCSKCTIYCMIMSSIMINNQNFLYFFGKNTKNIFIRRYAHHLKNIGFFCSLIPFQSNDLYFMFKFVNLKLQWIILPFSCQKNVRQDVEMKYKIFRIKYYKSFPVVLISLCYLEHIIKYYDVRDIKFTFKIKKKGRIYLKVFDSQKRKLLKSIYE